MEGLWKLGLRMRDGILWNASVCINMSVSAYVHMCMLEM